MSARDDYPALHNLSMHNPDSDSEFDRALDEIDHLRSWQQEAAGFIAEEWGDHEPGYWRDLSRPYVLPLLVTAGVQLDDDDDEDDGGAS